MSNIAYAYNRFCTKRFPLPSAVQVADLEHEIKVEFPDDYRRFLFEFNGGYFDDPIIAQVSEGCPLESLLFMYGIKASHWEAELGDPTVISLFDGNDPPLILPIGDTGLGSFIILRTEAEGYGTIYLKEAYGGFYYLADGIEEFFDLLHSPDSPIVNRDRR